jgi:hypothetical protein
MRAAAPAPWESAALSASEFRSESPASPDVRTLNSLAVRSLSALFDEKSQLFSQRIVLGKDGFHREPVSRRHTIIALLGLRQLNETAGGSPFDIGAIQNAVLEDYSWVQSLDDLGLLLWFAGACQPDRLPDVLKKFDLENALSFYPDGRAAYTTALASFMTGIATAHLSNGHYDLSDVAVDAYHLLQNNQGRSGLFGHAGAAVFPRRTSFRRLGTISDQMSAILALTMFARAFEIEEPLESALTCGNAVCALQGELGQWWFLYDRATGRVVGRYPVRSLHQYGAAPSALLALARATGQNFENAICRGLSWISGANELRDDLRNVDRMFIWDSIGPNSRLAKCLEAVLAFVRPGHRVAPTSLGIRYEARSDHFGWLLYAFGRAGVSSGSTGVQT